MRHALLKSLVLAASLGAGTAAASPRAPLQVAVVVGLDAGAFNAPTVDLYRAVSEKVQASTAWRVVGRSDVHDRLPAATNREFAALGGVPAVGRAEVVAAREGAAKQKRRKAKIQKESVIAPLQVALDTLAIDGAIVVDCAPNGLDAVDACGVYYYDRALGRILASSRKEFKVRITDASQWASTLVDSLDQGLQDYSNKRERARLDRVLATNSIDEDSGTALAAELRVGGVGLADAQRRVKSAPAAAIRFGVQAKSYTSGLELSYARGSEGQDAAETMLQDKAARLFFTLESRALDTMRWELDLGVAYGITTAAADDGDMDLRSVRLRIGPGAMWELTKSLQCGLGFTYDRLEPLRYTGNGVYYDKYAEIERNLFGFGVRLKTIF